MANALATQILVDGARNAVVKITGVVDTADITATDVVDPASFTPTPTRLRIDKITYSVEGGLAVRLWWDASSDVLIASLTDSSEIGARDYGGLINNAGSGITGKIQLTTEGWAGGAVYSFTVVLEMVKMGV
jgi:hypothetical protein